MKDYTVDELKQMLIEVIDANYGATVHDIGNGDGIQEPIASSIREFWEAHLTDYYQSFRQSKQEVRP